MIRPADRGPGYGRSAAERRLRRHVVLSALALAWERLWPRLWPAVFLALAFVAIALLDLPARLPAPLHALILALAVAAMAYALLHALPALRPVSRAAARRRLDRTAAGADRPLAALADRLADREAPPLTVALWEAHRQRMAAAATRLAVRWPAPRLADHEPWGIRAGVLLLLVIGIAAAGNDWRPRLERAISPALATAATSASIELWITPPGYTGKAPIFVRANPADKAGEGPPLVAPAGSTVLARVTGLAPALKLRAGERTAPFTPLEGEPGAAAARRAELTLAPASRLAIEAGRRELAAWALTVIPDRPPRIGDAGDPVAQPGGLLELGYEADDDYGVAEIEAVIRLTTGEGDGGTREAAPPLRVPLALSDAGAPAVAGRALLDLAAHPWAGRPVMLALAARDGIGQQSVGGAVATRLPERGFTHPVARAIVSERKRLIAGEDLTAIAVGLDRIASAPASFDHDVVVSLGLAVAYWRLLNERAAGSEAVRALLWELAVRLEDGGVPAAERRLAEARQQLQEALRRGADGAEIERLMDALTEALDAYLASLASEIDRRDEGDMAMLVPGDSLTAGDLRSLVERARELSRAGAREGARALLGELQRLVDGIRLGLRNAPGQAQLRAAQQSLDALGGLRDRQQQLLDDTFRRLRERQEQRRTGRRGSGDGDDKAAVAGQQEVRRDLAGIAERLEEHLGGVPQPLAAADQAMREALKGLSGDRLGDAVDAQARAVDALGRALAAGRQQLAEQAGVAVGLGAGQGGGEGDPFGRPAGPGSRGLALGNIAIPDSSEIGRIQELLRELRRRAGERERPRQELDYIDRLLQPF